MTLTTQDAFAATVAHELACEKSAGFVPLSVIPETWSGCAPEFMIKNVKDEVEPTAVEGKLKLDGLSDGDGGGTTKAADVK